MSSYMVHGKRIIPSLSEELAPSSKGALGGGVTGVGAAVVGIAGV
jgi:hypothetical protein